MIPNTNDAKLARAMKKRIADLEKEHIHLNLRTLSVDHQLAEIKKSTVDSHWRYTEVLRSTYKPLFTALCNVLERFDRNLSDTCLPNLREAVAELGRALIREEKKNKGFML